MNRLARARDLTGLTVAEYFRDQEGQDVLFFVIIFLDLPSSSEYALLGRIPSAVGYQPTLATDMGNLQKELLQQVKDRLHLYRQYSSS